MSKAVRAELLKLHETSDGILHPAKVVAWARKHRKSALHRQFEWNNSKAATEYRLWQARRLITLNVTTEDGTPKVVSLSFDRSRGGGYRDIADVRADRKLSDVLLHDALVELKRVQARYQRIRQLTKVWEAVERVRVRHEKKITPLKKAA